MTRPVNVANDAIFAISRMPNGSARIEAAERQVRQTEQEGPREALAYALNTLLASYFWGQQVERSFVVFSRLLTLRDEHPDLFDDHDSFTLFWSFKWMISGISEYPGISADTIERNLASMDERFRRDGLGLAAVAQQRFQWAKSRGDAGADVLFDEWRRMPRDEYSDCDLCEPAKHASWLIATDRLHEGIRVAESALAGGRTCAEQPVGILAELAEAYLAAGRDSDAAATFRRAESALADNETELADTRGTMIRFLARTGHADRCLRALDRDHHLLTRAETPHTRFLFLVAVGAATHMLSGGHGERPVRLRDIPVSTVAELDAWVRAEAEELGTAFDTRNGTDRYRRLIDEAWSTLPHPVRVDLSVLPAEGAAATQPRAQVSPEPGPVPERAEEPPTAELDRETRPHGGSAIVARAEELAATGDLRAAADRYVAAAAAFDDEGLLADAGFAWAEAAHAAAQLGDPEGASRGYTAAVNRLLAADAAGRLIVPIIVAWAEVAAAVGEMSVALGRLDDVHALLGPEDRDVRAGADLADTRARLLAVDGQLTEAAVVAREAAEAYADQRRPHDAAHAFWLTGLVHDALGQVDDAIWALESAVEGFGLARRKEDRLRAGNDLIGLLRREGRTEQMDRITAVLAPDGRE
jgi:tetratricopeptide (TPR) repeat protein